MSDGDLMAEGLRNLLEVATDMVDGVERLDSMAHGTKVGLLHLLHQLSEKKVLEEAQVKLILGEMQKAEANAVH